jgi:hypothetical protein
LSSFRREATCRWPLSRLALNPAPGGYKWFVMSKSDRARIDIDRVIEWRDPEGKLHCVDDPARVFPRAPGAKAAQAITGLLPALAYRGALFLLQLRSRRGGEPS